MRDKNDPVTIWVKWLLTCLAIIAVFCLIAFAAASIFNTAEANGNMMFYHVGHVYDANVYVDSETGVMYLSPSSGYTRGIYTVMLNADGTPRIWSE